MVKFKNLLNVNNPMSATTIYGVCLALTKGISLLMLPIVVRFLSPDEFGAMEILASIAVFGSVLVGFGLEDALFRFVGRTDSEYERAQVFSTILKLAWGVSIICLAILYPLLSQAVAWAGFEFRQAELLMVALILAMEGVLSVPLAWLRMQDRVWAFAFSSISRVILQSILTIVFLALDYGVLGVFLAGAIAVVIQVIFLTYMLHRYLYIPIVKSHVRPILSYSVPIILSGIVAFSLNGMDRWFIAERTTLQDLAMYAIAAKFALAVVLCMQPFQMWWNPKRFKFALNSQYQQDYCRYVSLGVVYCIAIASTLIFLAPILIELLMPKNYLRANEYVLALVTIFFFRELVELINFGCLQGSSTRAQLMINVLSACVGVGLFFIVPDEFGIWGLILSLIIAQAIRLVVFYSVSQKLFYLPYPIRFWFCLCAISGTFLLISTYFESPVFNALMALGNILCLTIFTFFKLGFLKVGTKIGWKIIR